MAREDYVEYGAYHGRKPSLLVFDKRKYSWVINADTGQFERFGELLRSVAVQKKSRRILRDVLIEASNEYIRMLQRGFSTGGEAIGRKWEYNFPPLTIEKGGKPPLKYTGLLARSFRIYIHDTGRGSISTVIGIPEDVKYPSQQSGNTLKSVGRIAEKQEVGYWIPVTRGVINRFVLPPSRGGFGIAAPKKRRLRVPPRPFRYHAYKKMEEKLKKIFLGASIGVFAEFLPT